MQWKGAFAVCAGAFAVPRVRGPVYEQADSGQMEAEQSLCVYGLLGCSGVYMAAADCIHADIVPVLCWFDPLQRIFAHMYIC